MSLTDILLSLIVVLLGVIAGLLWAILNESYSIEIVRRHAGEWVSQGFVSWRSKKIQKALDQLRTTTIRRPAAHWLPSDLKASALPHLRPAP
ncbi:MAG TPA: hypothetical protein VKX49_12670 [Bryobacteraceae bacterium]|nr:hypothetical protein [Bryobacteraceae bacterium]